APMGPAASPAGHPHHRNPVDGHPPCSPGTVTCRILGPRDEGGNLEPSAEPTTPFVEAHESTRGRRPGRPATPNSDKGHIFSVRPMRSSHSPGVSEVYGAATRAVPEQAEERTHPRTATQRNSRVDGGPRRHVRRARTSCPQSALGRAPRARRQTDLVRGTEGTSH